MPTLLLVEDNIEILSANCSYFIENGFAVLSALNGKDAITLLSKNQFDCIVLDVMLPDMDGYAVCDAARKVTSAPIIFLTCMDELDQKLKGLSSGGDDYLTKPYSLRELLVRVNNLIRRSSPRIIHGSGDFFIDEQNRMIHTPEKNVFLSQKEYALFMLLYQNRDQTFTRNEILALLWQGESDESIVAVYISKLRRKIGFAAKYTGELESVYGKGYCLSTKKSGGN